MVATPSASLSRQIHAEFSLSKQIRKSLNPKRGVSKQLAEIGTDYQRVVTSLQQPQIEAQGAMIDAIRKTQIKQLQPLREAMTGFAKMKLRHDHSIQNTMEQIELDTYRSIQKSLKPATIPIAATGATFGNIASQHRTNRTSWERPEPSPTTKSATTTPEVAIGEFPSNSEKVGEVITSRITPTMGFFAILGFSLGCAYLVANTPEEAFTITIQISGIIGGVKAMYEVSIFMLGDQ